MLPGWGKRAARRAGQSAHAPRRNARTAAFRAEKRERFPDLQGIPPTERPAAHLFRRERQVFAEGGADFLRLPAAAVREHAAALRPEQLTRDGGSTAEAIERRHISSIIIYTAARHRYAEAAPSGISIRRLPDKHFSNKKSRTLLRTI